MLNIKDKAPLFTLKDKNNNDVSKKLKEYKVAYEIVRNEVINIIAANILANK